MDPNVKDAVELRLKVSGSEQRVVGLNLALTLFFPLPFRDCAKQVGELFEKYLAFVPEGTFVWQNLGGTSQAYKALTRSAYATIRAWFGLQKKYSSMCAVWLKDGAAITDVGDYLFTLGGRDTARRPGESNDLQLFFPATQLERTKAPEFLTQIHAMLQHMPFHSGYLGYTLGTSTLDSVSGYSDPIADHVYAAVQRFRGLEIFQSVLENYEMAKQLRPPSWVTFLGDAFVERLGGPDAIASALGPGDFGFTQLDHGLSIRAGAEPLLADANRGEDIAPEQRALARLLEPYYSDKPAYLFSNRPHEDTVEWLRRHLP